MSQTRRRVVLTGACGYVAQRMFPELAERFDLVPIDVVETDRDGAAVPGVRLCDLLGRDRQECREHFEGADAVIHCAFVRGGGRGFGDTSDARFQAEHENVAMAFNVYQPVEEGWISGLNILG